MRTAGPAVRSALIVALVICGLLAGCGADSATLQGAYDRGYAAGLAAAQQPEMSDDCRSCYGLGFSEGYQQGYTDGAGKSTP
jgi:uncharacterized protein YfiM (DUF2279 family)